MWLKVHFFQIQFMNLFCFFLPLHHFICIINLENWRSVFVIYVFHIRFTLLFTFIAIFSVCMCVYVCLLVCFKETCQSLIDYISTTWTDRGFWYNSLTVMWPCGCQDILFVCLYLWISQRETCFQDRNCLHLKIYCFCLSLNVCI